MAKLVVNSDSLVSVADAIRTKGNTTDELEFPNGFVDGINAIESGGGGTEELENLIDKSGVLGTTDETATATEKVELLINYAEVLRNQANLQLQYNRTEHIDFYIDWVTSISFGTWSRLKRLVGVDLTKVDPGSGRNLFNDCVALVTIERPLDCTKFSAWNMGLMFKGCNNLVDVSFVNGSIHESITIPSPVLSDESIKSIINGLATVTTAQTLTLHADVKAKLTDEQKATITNKNWNLA